MQARYTTTAYKSTYGHICLQCRYGAVLTANKQYKRFQHTEGPSPPETQDVSSVPSFSDGVRNSLPSKGDAKKEAESNGLRSTQLGSPQEAQEAHVSVTVPLADVLKLTTMAS